VSRECTFNPLKYTAISDLADTRNIHVFALTETWITPSATPSELRNAAPSGFFLVSHPRIAPGNHAHVVGGGTAFLLEELWCSGYSTLAFGCIVMGSNASSAYFHIIVRQSSAS